MRRVILIGHRARGILALLCGIMIQGGLIGLSVWLDSTGPVWNVILFVRLAGPGLMIGHYPDGRPMYEGTPAHVVFAALGTLAGVLLYALVVYALMRSGSARRPESRGNA
jgi:hypothetical protein